MACEQGLLIPMLLSTLCVTETNENVFSCCSGRISCLKGVFLKKKKKRDAARTISTLWAPWRSTCWPLPASGGPCKLPLSTLLPSSASRTAIKNLWLSLLSQPPSHRKYSLDCCHQGDSGPCPHLRTLNLNRLV